MKLIRMDEKSVNDFWQLRQQLFEELNESEFLKNKQKLENATKEFYLSHINKELVSWGVTNENKLIASSSLCLFERIPYQENLTGKEGYILNIYTCPKYRKQGIASQLLNEMMTYAKQNQINRLWLNSSDDGKSLYKEYGFIEKSNEMELFL
ncbi:GNAT family N-acetyltransferase [Carnobacterium divergens]|uniref:GNAT family N-acetyltransferase n=2 Tax=Carnobacterium divergens TaxID=2748 RepID=A0AAW8RBH9_CARDV|nr:GNAT family N-acetyltransferase [Carnobacterium divergens]MDT1958800.1 GNAT family N-acetyltransferase [Carnobacterium divergens]MDT1974768.1 GNAT family N-acetyltransferase [Carnobacterium divergens]